MKHDLFRMKIKIDEIQLRNRKIESVLEAEDEGWGLRVFDKGVGFCSGNGDVNWELAKRMARLNRSPEIELPTECKAKDVKVFDKRMDADFVRDFAEKFISISDGKVMPTFSKFRLYTLETIIENSEGLDVAKTEKILRFETSLKVGNGKRTGEVFEVKWSRSRDGIGEKDIAAMMKGAESSLTAEKPKEFCGPVIFSPGMVCDMLVPVVGYHAGGEALYTKKTAFREGKMVADGKLTVFDDSTYPWGILSTPFDGEGVACRKVCIIDGGKFSDRLNDSLYGTLTKKGSTGNATRLPIYGGPDVSYSIPPYLSESNLCVKEGRKTLKQMIAGLDHGLLIEACSWVNPDNLTGDFGSEIRRGFIIEKGRIRAAIKGGNVSGNVLDMIRDVESVGNRAEICSGHTLAAVAPYVCFGNVKVSV